MNNMTVNNRSHTVNSFRRRMFEKVHLDRLTTFHVLSSKNSSYSIRVGVLPVQLPNVSFIGMCNMVLGNV